MNTSAHRRGTAAAFLVAAAVTAGCSGSEVPLAPTAQAEVDGAFPVTVESCGVATTYDRAPERVVTVDVNITETFLSLGLGDRLVGAFGLADRDDVLPELADDLAAVTMLSGQYPELEPLLATAPDFVAAGWSYGFAEAKNITPATLSARSVDTYAITESCARVQPEKPTTSIEESWADLLALGRIFGVSERAEAIVAEQRASLADVEEAIEGVGERSVFVYDSGEAAPFTAPALALPNDLINRAGGVNIFADLDQTWGEVSWEQVVERDPDCIVIVDYGETTWEEKRAFLQRTPGLSEMTAVRQGCIGHQPYAALTPGVRNEQAVREVAELIHPEAFSGT